MSIQPALPNTGNVIERFAGSIADLQRQVAAAQAADGYVPPGSISGGSGGQIVASSITTSEIAAGTIVASNIAAGTITGTLIAASTITTTNLAANAIDGMTITGATVRTSATAGSGGIGAGIVMTATSIKGYDGTANKFTLDATTGLVTAEGFFVVRSGSTVPAVTLTGFLPGSANRYSNSTFQDGQGNFDVTGWSVVNAVAAGSTAVQVPYGALVARLTATGSSTVSVTTTTNTDAYRRVIPGFAYTFSHYVYPSTTARQTRIDVSWYDNSGTLLSTTSGTAQNTTLNTWSRPAQTLTAPANAVYAKATHSIALVTASNELFYVTGFQMEEGDRISAYAPRPDEVLINTITANQITAGAITTAKLAAGAVTASTISAGAIDGTTITGATVQSSSSNPKTVLNTSGFSLVNASGVTKLALDTTNGLRLDGSAGTGWVTNSAVDWMYDSSFSVPAAAIWGSGISTNNNSQLMLSVFDTSGNGRAGGSAQACAIRLSGNTGSDSLNTIQLFLSNAARGSTTSYTLMNGQGGSSFVLAGNIQRVSGGAVTLTFSGTNSATATTFHGLQGVPVSAAASCQAIIGAIICSVGTFTSTSLTVTGVSYAGALTGTFTAYWVATA